MIRICFVCLGNICRSPTAEGIMRALVAEAGLDDRIAVDSAGTGAYHVGERPDARARRVAAARGVELVSRARRFVADDFDRFDYVIALDSDNLDALRRLARTEADESRLHLLRSFDPASGDETDVPDPFFGESDGFDRVFDICEAGCRGLLASLLRRDLGR